MREMIVVIGLVATFTSARADTPTPVHPLEILTEIGSVASDGGKVTVHARAIVTKAKIKLDAKVESSEVLAGTLELSEGDLKELEAALKDIIAAPDKDTTKMIGKTTVACKEEKDKRVVVITSGTGFQAVRLTLDMDNAESLAKMLKRTQSVHGWMKEKLPLLMK